MFRAKEEKPSPALLCATSQTVNSASRHSPMGSDPAQMGQRCGCGAAASLPLEDLGLAGSHNTGLPLLTLCILDPWGPERVCDTMAFSLVEKLGTKRIGLNIYQAKYTQTLYFQS